MTKDYSLPLKDLAKSWILLGIPVLSIIGCLMHFVYEWSGKSIIVGFFAPINESIWEHLKLAFWPFFIWWFVGYLLHGKNNKISASKWFVSCVIAELACPLVVMSFFYIYTGALGIESLVLDIFSFILGVALGQGLALHVYKYANPGHSWLYISIIILVFLAATFTVFTFDPPQIPLFKDSLTGKYGV